MNPTLLVECPLRSTRSGSRQGIMAPRVKTIAAPADVIALRARLSARNRKNTTRFGPVDQFVVQLDEHHGHGLILPTTPA